MKTRFSHPPRGNHWQRARYNNMPTATRLFTWRNTFIHFSYTRTRDNLSTTLHPFLSLSPPLSKRRNFTLYTLDSIQRSSFWYAILPKILPMSICWAEKLMGTRGRAERSLTFGLLLYNVTELDMGQKRTKDKIDRVYLRTSPTLRHCCQFAGISR